MARRWLRSGERRRPRPARPRGDRAGARRGVARRGQRRRAARCAAVARLSHAEEAEATPGWGDWLDALARDKRVARLKAPHATLMVTAERLPQFRALWPEARLEPAIAPPPDQAGGHWSPSEALIEILRGRLEGLGPVTATASPPRSGWSRTRRPRALAALKAKARLRGRFTPDGETRNGATAACWRASTATPSGGCARRSSP